ncbi:lipocalin family protein, partial [Morganella morganii]
MDNRFEKGLSKVTANYSLRDDGGVKVINRGWDASN